MTFELQVTNKTITDSGELLLEFSDGTVLEFNSENGFIDWCNQDVVNNILESIKYRITAAWFISNGPVDKLLFNPDMNSVNIIRATQDG